MCDICYADRHYPIINIVHVIFLSRIIVKKNLFNWNSKLFIFFMFRYWKCCSLIFLYLLTSGTKMLTSWGFTAWTLCECFIVPDEGQNGQGLCGQSLAYGVSKINTHVEEEKFCYVHWDHSRRLNHVYIVAQKRL